MKSIRTRTRAIYMVILVSIILCLTSALLKANPLDNWHWRIPYPHGNDLYKVTYGNGMYVIAGDAGTILYSRDGIQWTNVEPPEKKIEYRSIAYGNGVFVAVGYDFHRESGPATGAICTSLDGIKWTVEESQLSFILNKVAYGNGLFAAIGESNRILISEDAVTWSSIEVDVVKQLLDIAYLNGIFITVGYAERAGEQAIGTILTSSDGLRWKRRVSRLVGVPYQIAYGNGTYFVICSAGKLTTSSDGISWLEGESEGLPRIYAMAYGNGKFVATGLGTIFTSEDGRRWEDKNLQCFGYLYDVTYAKDLFIAVGCGGMIFTSTNGDTWAGKCDQRPNPSTSAAYGNGTFVVVGGNVTLTSSDGVSWTENQGGEQRETLFFNGTIFVSHGRYSRKSSDGVTWEEGFGSDAMVYGKGLFVFLDYDRHTQRNIVAVSTDGIHWTSKPLELLGEQGAITGIAYGNGMFVIIGWDNILTSTDGLNWTARKLDQSYYIDKVIYAGGKFVALGGGIMTSSDGINWEYKYRDLTTDFIDITYGNNTFVAVGINNSENKSKIVSSIDGVNWVESAFTTHCSLVGIAFGADTFLAVGGTYGGRLILQSDHFNGPKISAIPSSLVFENIEVGRASEQTITVQNKGTTDLTIETISSPSAPFIKSEDQCSNHTLGPGESCSIKIQFTPTFIGISNSFLEIISNDQDRPNLETLLTGKSTGIDLTGNWVSAAYTCVPFKQSEKCKIIGTISIQNEGTQKSRSSHIKFYLSDDEVYDEGVDIFLKQISTGNIKMKASKVMNLSYSFRPGDTALGKYIIAVIDAHNKVMEADENNNFVVFGPIGPTP